MEKQKCDICDRTIHGFVMPFYLKDGVICDKCAKKVDLEHTLGNKEIQKAAREHISLQDVNDHISQSIGFDYKTLKIQGKTEIKEEKEKNKEIQRKRLEKYRQDNAITINNLLFDNVQKKLLIKATLLYPQQEVNYSNIANYSKILNGKNTKKHHALLRAATGAALLGGVGAIVGATTGGKQYETVTKMAVIINFTSGANYEVKFIHTETKQDSFVFRSSQKDYLKLCGLLDQIISANNIKMMAESTKAVEVPNKAPAPSTKPDTPTKSDVPAQSDNSENDIAKLSKDLHQLKELADDGIITQEEFSAKKKQLLGL